MQKIKLPGKTVGYLLEELQGNHDIVCLGKDALSSYPMIQAAEPFQEIQIKASLW